MGDPDLTGFRRHSASADLVRLLIATGCDRGPRASGTHKYPRIIGIPNTFADMVMSPGTCDPDRGSRSEARGWPGA